MYESWFQFAARPFAHASHPQRYFPGMSMEQARHTLSNVIDGALGPGLVIGPPGTGKTLLCQVLADRFRDRFRVVLLASNRLCTRRALLQNILFELRLPYRDMDEGELRLSLIDHLEPSPACPHGMLLLVDEAHCLPLRLLEELRMITNLVRDGQPRVRLVLVAGSVFEERLASPRLESLNQRIAARCYLHSLNREETIEYVRAQVRWAGGNPDTLFEGAALHAVFQASDGIPRLINQVCDHALVLAAVAQRLRLDAAGIEEAWADLQQLPLPWTQEKHEQLEQSHATLEFGLLEDEPAATTTPTTSFEVCADVFGTRHEPLTSLHGLERSDDDGAETLPNHPYSADRDHDFTPVARSTPEVELHVPPAADPFAEPFAEEEVVVDRFAALSDGNVLFGMGPTAHGDGVWESSWSAATITSAGGKTIATDEDGPADTALQVVHAFADEAAKALSTPRIEGPVRLVATFCDDDSDLLVLDDDADIRVVAMPTTDSPIGPADKARRRDYSQLFATLRGE